jgi:hypothetical protein
VVKWWKADPPPFDDGKSTDRFIGTGQGSGDTKKGIGTAGAKYIGCKGIITIRGLNKNLGLPEGRDKVFEMPKAMDTCLPFDGKVTVESKRLSVEAGSDECKEDGRRAYKRNDRIATMLGFGNDPGAWIGDGRTSGFGEQTDGDTLFKGCEEDSDTLRRRVLVKLVEGKGVNHKRGMGFFEEATGRTGILDDEMMDRQYNIQIMTGENLPMRSVSKRYGNEVKRHGAQVKLRES